MIKKVVALVAISFMAFLASSASSFGSDSKGAVVNLKCKWVAGKKKEGQIKFVEGEDFDFPVVAEKGFFFHLENGMTDEQKRVIYEAGQKFVEQNREKIQKKGCSVAGLICRDERTGEEVIILYNRGQ